MSANNQILIKNHEGKFYVFDNIMAESWCDRNCLNINKATKRFDTVGEAFVFAHTLDDTEYGVIDGRLAKDNAEVDLYE